MTREEAKAWFEGHTNLCGDAREAYALAIEALSQPKFIALREGDIAVLNVDGRITQAQAEYVGAQWLRLTGKRPIILDGGCRLAGCIAAPELASLADASAIEVLDAIVAGSQEVRGAGENGST